MICGSARNLELLEGDAMRSVFVQGRDQGTKSICTNNPQNVFKEKQAQLL